MARAKPTVAEVSWRYLPALAMQSSLAQNHPTDWGFPVGAWPRRIRRGLSFFRGIPGGPTLGSTHPGFDRACARSPRTRPKPRAISYGFEMLGTQLFLPVSAEHPLDRFGDFRRSVCRAGARRSRDSCLRAPSSAARPRSRPTTPRPGRSPRGSCETPSRCRRRRRFRAGRRGFRSRRCRARGRGCRGPG